MKKLKALGVGSVFRVSAILGAVAGLLVGVILLIVNIMDKRVMEGFVTLLLAPLLYGVLGALANAFMAWVYNIVADKFGGIELTFED